jgi:hypothetical protein
LEGADVLVSDLRVREGRPRPGLANSVDIVVRRIFENRMKRIERMVGVPMSND